MPDSVQCLHASSIFTTSLPRYKRGYKNVISKGQELAAQGTPAALMMETSGHGALADNNYLDDGAALAVLAVIQMVRLKVSGG